MSSETTMIAEKCRLQEWAAQIRDCQSRPAGMTVVSWSPNLPANCRKPGKDEVK